MTENPTKPTTLAAALVLAQATAESVAKGAKNTFHNYKYASAEAIIEEARGALHSAGLALVTVGWEPMDGGAGRAYRVRSTYRLICAASGESQDFTTSSPVIPEKGRPEDKAEFGALTENLGYFLRGLLLLPRVDETTTVSARDDRPKVAPPVFRPVVMTALPAQRPPVAVPSPAAEPMLESVLGYAARNLEAALAEASNKGALITVGGMIKAALGAGEITQDERAVLKVAYDAKSKLLGGAK